MLTRRTILRTLILGAAVVGGAGCYRHVVDAKGYGAAGTSVYEPNIQEPGKSRRTPMQRKPPERMRSDNK